MVDDVEELLSDVAAAARLEEGRHGVEEIVRRLYRVETAAIRSLSRGTGLPVPVVAAVCAELRRAGLVTAARPARLSERGRALAQRLATSSAAPCTCPRCQGRGFTVRSELGELAPRLASMLRYAPPADPTLDQSHCTVASKLRRIAYMEEAGALSGRSVLLLGDDDCMSVAIMLAARAARVKPPARLLVVDVDPAIVDFTRAAWARIGAGAEALEHNLRHPLPAGMAPGFDTVLTDPPYTQAGAELFLSRAAGALGPGPRKQVFCCFGPKSPRHSARFQHAITGMGFGIHALIRNFNDYEGAGVLAGTSHLYHLLSAARLDPSVVGTFTQPIYTGQLRAPRRFYVCRGCGARLVVGTGQRWATIGELQSQGCPRCRGDGFRAGPRSPIIP